MPAPAVTVRALGLSWVRKFGQWDKWKGCSLTAIKMAETRSNDDTTSTPEPHSSIQGEGGLGCPDRRQDPGRAGPAVRCPCQPDHRLEDADAGRRGQCLWRGEGRAAG